MLSIRNSMIATIKKIESGTVSVLIGTVRMLSDELFLA